MKDSLISGICPKCGSDEIYYAANDLTKVVPRRFSGALLYGDRPTVDNLVCGNCGYLELYVAPEELRKMKNTWYRMQKREASE